MCPLGGHNYTDGLGYLCDSLSSESADDLPLTIEVRLAMIHCDGNKDKELAVTSHHSLPVQQQKGGSDCGLFIIALCTI